MSVDTGESGTSNPPEFNEEQQKKINSILAEEKRKAKAQLDTLAKELDGLKGAAKEKEALQAKLAEMQNTYLTNEEKAKIESEKQRVASEEVINGLKTQATKWQGLFEQSIKRQAIIEAASKHNAFKAEQLERLLNNDVKVVATLNDAGEEVGYNVVMPMKTKDGKTIEVSVMDGVGKMRESEDFSNLFYTDSKPGSGPLQQNGKVKGGDPTKPPTDPT